MKYLSEHFREVEKRAKFPPESVEIFEKAAARIDADPEFSAKFEKIRRGYMYPKPTNLGRIYIPKIEKLAEEYGIHPYTLEMVFLVVCSELLYKRYKKKGISEEIYWNGIDDFRCKLLECIECEGVHGTFVADWNDGFFAMNRFALGRFQFEYDTFGDSFTTSAGVKIKKGQRCINFHIPSSGIPLTDDVRFDAYKRAYEFFSDVRTKQGYLILRCSSWLLFPKHREFLPENSNILRFMDDFEIYDYEEKDGFHDDWRIWGHYSDVPLEERPADTGLRAAYKKWMMAGNKTGYGRGVIVFDGKKIIK